MLSVQTHFMEEIKAASPVATPQEFSTVVMVKDPQLQADLKEIALQHKGAYFLGYEFAWVLLIWAFRAWRLSKAGTLLLRLWVQAWIAVVFWIVSLTVVPLLVWDGAYQNLFSHAVKLALKSILE